MPSLDGFLESMQSDALKAIIRHWDAVRGEKTLPAFGQLHLSSLSAPINRMWVYRYDRLTRRFTGRLASDEIAAAMGKNFQGLPLEEAHSAQTYLWVHGVLTRVVSEPAFYRSSGNLYRQAGQLIRGERIGLPLGDDGTHADGVLGVSDFPDPHLEGPYELLNENEAWLSLADKA